MRTFRKSTKSLASQQLFCSARILKCSFTAFCYTLCFFASLFLVLIKNCKAWRKKDAFSYCRIFFFLRYVLISHLALHAIRHSLHEAITIQSLINYTRLRYCINKDFQRIFLSNFYLSSFSTDFLLPLYELLSFLFLLKYIPPKAHFQATSGNRYPCKSLVLCESFLSYPMIHYFL